MIENRDYSINGIRLPAPPVDLELSDRRETAPHSAIVRRAKRPHSQRFVLVNTRLAMIRQAIEEVADEAADEAIWE